MFTTSLVVLPTLNLNKNFKSAMPENFPRDSAVNFLTPTSKWAMQTRNSALYYNNRKAIHFTDRINKKFDH